MMACNSPLYRPIKGEWMPLPCGRCPPCKKRRVDGWVFRLLEEDKVSQSAHFITLTYDPAHVPISKNGFMTLDKTEFPRFMKRLRKLVMLHTIKQFGDLDNAEELASVVVPKLKYYACGEYGSTNKRPHYHAIVFNVPDDKMFFEAWKLDGIYFGEVHVGNVTGNSVAYTMKYIDKAKNEAGLYPGWRPFVGRDDRVPEFALMSKGMGKSYMTDRIRRYHNADLNRNYLTVDGGFKIAMPRYYKERIFDEDARAAMGSLAQAAANKAESDNYAKFLKYHSSGDIDYQTFKDGQRTAVVNRFYSSIKKRD